jgi:hypothetical protein
VTVDEAKSWPVVQRDEEVAAESVLKVLLQVKGSAPAMVESVPQYMRPVVSDLTSQAAALRLDTMSPVEEAVPSRVEEPMLLIEKRVECAPLLEVEPMTKAVRWLVEEARLKENCAQGEEVPAAIWPMELMVRYGTVVVPRPVVVLEAIMKRSEEVEVLLASMVSCAIGVVVPRPTKPAKYAVPCTMSAGVLVP